MPFPWGVLPDPGPVVTAMRGSIAAVWPVMPDAGGVVALAWRVLPVVRVPAYSGRMPPTSGRMAPLAQGVATFPGGVMALGAASNDSRCGFSKDSWECVDGWRLTWKAQMRKCNSQVLLGLHNVGCAIPLAKERARILPCKLRW